MTSSAIAQKIRMSTSLEEAQKLAAEMQTKAEQLTTGVDADKNGKISWNKPEGGLAPGDSSTWAS